MSSRRPRRQRRRPRERTSTLPRPGAVVQPAHNAGGETVEQAQLRPEHHVMADYRYVRRDLVIVGVVSAVTFAFVLVAAVIA